MAGYSYEDGMSHAALDAYESGNKPLSKITVQDLKWAGWQGTKSDAIRLAKSGFWRPCEWHHSGGTWYNRVDFYDPAELVEKWEEASADSRSVALAQDAPTDEKRVAGEYKLWGGSRKHPTVVGYEKFTGTLRGDWIHLDGGGKKKASGNHVKWEVIT